MFKKFISMSTAAILLATGISFVGATSANAGPAPVISSTSTLTLGAVNPTLTITSATNFEGNQGVRYTIVPGTTGISSTATYSGGTTTTLTVSLTGTVTAGTLTFKVAEDITSSTPASNTLSFVISPGAAPTLTALSYRDGGQPTAVSGFSASTTSYSITAYNASVSVPTATVSAGTAVHTCNGTTISASSNCSLNSGSNTYTIVVSNSGQSTTYTITFNYTAPGGGSSSAPSQTAEEIAAAAAAVAKAAADAAAAIRAAEIATAQTALSTVLKSDKPGTLSEYRSANINISTTAGLTRLNAEVLKLSAADRADFAKIKAIADKIEFDESFFNATTRPTAATYSTYGVTGVTERILPTINAKVLELPAAARLDVKAIQEIAKVENFVDRVANTETRSTVSATALISNGLLPATSPYKYSVVKGLGAYPEGSLNSMAKIEAAVKEQIAKAEAPKRRLAEIKAKIAARNK